MDGVLNYKGRIFIPRVDHFIPRLLAEAGDSRYSIHLSVTKMIEIGYEFIGGRVKDKTLRRLVNN